MKFRYASDQRLWDLPDNETRKAIAELLDLHFQCLYYQEAIV